MKHAIIALSLITLTTPALAQTPNTTQVAQSIIELTKTAQTMNLKAVSSKLALPDLYGNAIYQGSNGNDKLQTRYQNLDPKHPIQSVRHSVWLDMGSGYTVVKGAVEFEFKNGECPSTNTLARLSGGRVDRVKLPTPPSIITGQGDEYDWVYVHFDDKSLSVSPDGCRISEYGEAKFGVH